LFFSFMNLKKQKKEQTMARHQTKHSESLKVCVLGHEGTATLNSFPIKQKSERIWKIPKSLDRLGGIAQSLNKHKSSSK
jgi:hypothetical protein